MKKTVVYLLFFIPIHIFAQCYFSEGTSWTVAIKNIGEQYTSEYTVLSLQGDSTIDGKIYRKFANSSNLIREENGKVYARIDSEFPFAVSDTRGDVLIYDFTMQIGDSIPTYNCGPLKYAVVENIDSITLLDGKRCGRYRYNKFRESDIVGIGSERGFLGPLLAIPIGVFSYLTCYKQEGKILYKNHGHIYPDGNCCRDEIGNNLVEINDRAVCTVQGNALKFHLKSKYNMLLLYNEKGILVSNCDVSNRLEKEIVNLPVGMYFYALISDEGNRMTGKSLIGRYDIAK